MAAMDLKEVAVVANLDAEAEADEELHQKERAVTIMVLVAIVMIIVMLKFQFPLHGLLQKLKSKEEMLRSKLKLNKN